MNFYHNLDILYELTINKFKQLINNSELIEIMSTHIVNSSNENFNWANEYDSFRELYEAYLDYEVLRKIKLFSSVNNLKDFHNINTKVISDKYEIPCTLSIEIVDMVYTVTDYINEPGKDSVEIKTPIDIGDIDLGGREGDIPFVIVLILYNLADWGTNHNG